MSAVFIEVTVAVLLCRYCDYIYSTVYKRDSCIRYFCRCELIVYIFWQLSVRLKKACK